MKSSILVLVSVGLAFAWGYIGKDTSKLISAPNSLSSSPESLTSASNSSLKDKATQSGLSTSTSANRALAKKRIFGTPSTDKIGKGQIGKRFKGTNTISNEQVPGYVANYRSSIKNKPGINSNTQASRNPYANFMKSLSDKSGSDNQRQKLGENVKDFKQAPITEGRRQRRNAYFDKLSEQLKNLQGNNIAPVAEPDKEQESASEEAAELESPEVENEEIEFEDPNSDQNLDPGQELIEDDLGAQIDDEIQDFLDNPEDL